jgi:predicted DNA-binding transcriptional regulator AlpA
MHYEGLNMTGRPSWIPNETSCNQVQEMASRGLTVAQIASCLGISETTLYKKQNEYAEFMQSIKKGRAEGINQVSNALFEKATQGNVTAMIYYLKTRDRENWGENQPEPLKEIPPMKIILNKA